ncbi:hypothetical protein SLOPH_724 [Spraguea lophii 42_110]|uniref:Uncharacterized protein n=1 Tax=Spraguea lophii (strain 42_110) TaxID=1358809 RepID=S7XUL4_SPRLO|nr:hypothetical protein SLOPH_724 [Spraguea lophii 42_110]
MKYILKKNKPCFNTICNMILFPINNITSVKKQEKYNTKTENTRGVEIFGIIKSYMIFLLLLSKIFCANIVGFNNIITQGRDNYAILTFTGPVNCKKMYLMKNTDPTGVNNWRIDRDMTNEFLKAYTPGDSSIKLKLPRNSSDNNYYCFKLIEQDDTEHYTQFMYCDQNDKYKKEKENKKNKMLKTDDEDSDDEENNITSNCMIALPLFIVLYLL